jgi:alcohol dehydrogenase class IV
MSTFQFATATKIVFGPGSLAELPRFIAGMGQRALLVLGESERFGARTEALCGSAGVRVHKARVSGEPTVENVLELITAAREAGVELVIGVGGGSVVDGAKAVAALLANPGDPLDFLEVIGRGRPLERAPLPFVAVPTTAGTGAEVTKNAVLASTEHAVKVSLRSDSMLPRVALVDPELTLTLPPPITAATGLDALTQVLEPFVSRSANPVTDALSREGMSRAARGLRRAYHDGADLEARTDMALVSLFGGITLANAKLGAVHGFAGPIGGMFPAPHGAVCARLLPLVVERNIAALRARAPQSPVLGRYDEVARILTGRQAARADDAALWLRELVNELEVPPLGRYGLSAAHVSEVVQKSKRASSMQGNPIVLTDDELARTLEAAI